ncbi:MAG: hypothetical protein RJB60_3072 [Pseudomonadota bacterium]|jgi:uncharacterized protein VirK/YbjX
MFSSPDARRGLVKPLQISCVLLLTAILFMLDLLSGPYWSFAVFYYADIALASAWGGPLFAHLVASLTSVARAYGVVKGYPPSEPMLTAVWTLLTYTLLHNCFCYLINLFWRVKKLFSPEIFPFLKDELPIVRQFVFSPYVHSSWGTLRKMEMIATHHRLIEQLLPALDIGPEESVDLYTQTLPNGLLRVVIDRPQWMRSEGELAISLFWNVDRIYTAMVLLGGTLETPHLMIGAFQGDGRDRKELYKELTKALHGLRPRDYLLNMVKLVAKEAGCAAVWGISDRTHRSNHPLTRARKDVSYDQVWSEHEGQLCPQEGFFFMPTHIERRTAEEIPTQKRAMYRRRHELLDQIEQHMGSRLHQG